MKAAECHALKKTPKTRKKGREKGVREEDSRKQGGFLVVLYSFFFNKMSRKRFPAARKG